MQVSLTYKHMQVFLVLHFVLHILDCYPDIVDKTASFVARNGE